MVDRMNMDKPCPYKNPLRHDETCAIIKEMKMRFDPTVYSAFKECAGEFNRLFEENRKKSGSDFS